MSQDANGPEGKNSKPSNPKDAAAFGKRIAWSVIPWRVLAGLALALAEGAWKYGRHNYRPAGVRASVYIDACLRHLFAWVEGQDIDPASNLSHIDKAMACLVVLRDSMLQGNWDDDRPPRVEGDWIACANIQYEALAERMRAEFGEPKAPFRECQQLGGAQPERNPFAEVIRYQPVDIAITSLGGKVPDTELGHHVLDAAVSELERHRVGQ